MRYHDRDFVTNCYRAICKRPPHEIELTSDLAQLRGDHITKVQFVQRLLGSVEGRKNEVNVTGLKSTSFKRIAELPIIGYAIRIVTGLIRLPVLMKHQREFETYSLGQQQQIVDYVNVVRDDVLNHSLDASVIADITEAITILFDTLADLSGKTAALESDLAQATAALTQTEASAAALQQSHEQMKTSQEATVRTNQEFLIQEQAAIVATQKMVISGIENQLKELSDMQQRLSADLLSQRQRLESVVEDKGLETTATRRR